MPNMKKVAILQSNYIPWKGYFDLIAAVDEFILYDDMQYTKNDWRNRNKIKTPNGLTWLTIPVENNKHLDRKINETKVIDARWCKKHWDSLRFSYAKSPHFTQFEKSFEKLYESCANEPYLSNINYAFIKFISESLGISTKITSSSQYQLIEGKTERLVDLCEKAGATEYISGPAAKDYIGEELFAEANIKLTWFDYTGYPPYPQLWGDFEHAVSIVDLLFNCGKDASKYMRYVA